MLSRLSIVAALALLAAAAQAQTAPAGVARLGLRPQYSLNAGALVAGRYGSATYLMPMVSVPVTQRFSVFGGVTYLRTVAGPATAPFGENRLAFPAATNRFLLHGGGQYALSPRVMLTGSAWKDLTPTAGPAVSPYAGFGGNMGTGVHLRADYHITENFSVSGGVRVSNGATAYPGSYSPLFGPGVPGGY
ncbi:hypothetical protein [Hymenobacter metallilatus]|uniref:Outer membrane protein beta-barrel domain-containing protein n=1 Tax=Hymenobacter metallilatus TaxID=2493666 RepID=A0A3R9M9J1_9BACT|nr:hypothetical protein [Hymenobacter metallilatus]RSK36191.1 hypothetical protein EI290_04720 [Hymenobacter metallilatus]